MKKIMLSLMIDAWLYATDVYKSLPGFTPKYALIMCGMKVILPTCDLD